MRIIKKIRVLLRCSTGAATIEYAYTIAIAAIAMVGVFELFRAVGIGILIYFIELLKTPYP